MAKQKTCRVCKEKFTPFRFGQVVCTNNNFKCAREYGNNQREKRDAKEKKEFRMETKRLKTELNKSNYKHWLKKAQPAFNKFIRIRDKDEPCISCGRTVEQVEAEDGWMSRGQWDCGHYLTVGGFPELRFNEDNAHKQCKRCNASSNSFSRKGRTTHDEYRINLIKKIGIDRVERIEGPHEPKHYSADDLKEKQRFYNAKAREQEKNNV